MLNNDELEFLENIVLSTLEDEDNINRLKDIIDKLKKNRNRNISYSQRYNKRNKELHSLYTMLARYRKQNNQDKIAETEERIRQIRELSELDV